MLTVLAKLLKLLNSDTNPAQLALAVCFGLSIGLMPGFSALLLVLFILVCVIKANLTLFLLVWGIFEGVAYVFDPLIHQLGYWVLTQPSLSTFFTELLNSSVWTLAAINNTLVMGAALVILALWLPVFFLVKVLVVKYRSNIQRLIEKFKIVQMLKGSKFFKLYQELGA